MDTVMRHKKTVNVRDRVAQAVLDVAARDGVAGLAGQAVAKAAKIPMADVRAVAADTSGLVACALEWLDNQAAPVEAEGSKKDQAFEWVMNRIDIMQAHRAGAVALVKGVACDSSLWAALGPAWWSGVRAHPEVQGKMPTPDEIIKSIGLSMVYIMTLRTWIKDKSEDLGLTMAELDRRLTQAERLAGFCRSQP